MAKKSAVGQITFFKETPKKRPNRHAKSFNKDYQKEKNLEARVK
jgi:hypothetical protein